MKKKIFGAVVVVAIVVGAMINVNLNKTSNKGDLAMANVEALAQSEVSALGQWYNNNVAPWIINGETFKGRESYSKRIETGGTTYGSSYSYNVGANVSQSGVGASAGYSYNSEHTNVNFTTIYCCKDSINATSCDLPSNPLC